MSTGCKNGTASLFLFTALMVFKTNLAWCCGIGFSGKLFISGSCGGLGAGSVKTGTTGLGGSTS